MNKSMVQQWLKYAHKSRYRKIIFVFLADLAAGSTSAYDIKILQGEKNRWRVRLGNVRIILKKDNQGNFVVLKIQERGNVYKK